MESPNADLLELMASATSEPSGKRFSLTGLIVPILVLILTLALIGGEYEGRILYSVDSGRIAHYDEAALDLYGQELLEAIWRFSQQHNGDTIPVPVQWDVKSNAKDSRVELSYVAAGMSNTTNLLASLDSAFMQKLTETANLHASKANREKEFLSSQQNRLNEGIQSLNNSMQSLSDNLSQDDLVQSFRRNMADLEQTRQQYDELRRTLDSAVEQRDELIRSPAPTVADVPQEARKAAHNKNITLVQDLKELEVQLAQVRAALLKTDQKATTELQELVEASSLAVHLSDMVEARNVTGQIRDVLEEIVDKASRCNKLVTRFAQSWTTLFDSIRAIDIDSTDQTLLTLYRDLNDKIEEFLPASSELVKQLQEDTRYMTELAATTTAHQALTDAATRATGRLQAAQRRFAWSASDITGDHNYILDSALQSARGLLHRANAVRKEIDEELNQNALRQAARAKRNRIDDLSEQVDQLRNETTGLVDKLFAAQQKLENQFSSLPRYVQDTIDFRVAKKTSDLLASEKQRAAHLLAEADNTHSAPPVDPKLITMLDKKVSHIPVNLAQLLVSGAVAFGLALLAINVLTRFRATRRMA